MKLRPFRPFVYKITGSARWAVSVYNRDSREWESAGTYDSLKDAHFRASMSAEAS